MNTQTSSFLRSPWLAPCVSMCAVGIWIAATQYRANALAAETAELHARIAEHAKADASQTGPGIAKEAVDSNDSSPDWKTFGDVSKRMSAGDPGAIRSLVKARQHLLSLTPAELAEEFESVCQSGLTGDPEKLVKNLILGLITEKDPSLALAIMDKRPHLPFMRSLKGPALRKLAETNPAAAQAWMDGQMAAGKFNSKSLQQSNHDHLYYESQLVGAFLKSDPKSATQRIVGFPADQRAKLLKSGGFHDLNATDTKTFLNLARATLSEADFMSVLLNQSTMTFAGSNYKKVDSLLANPGLSPDEKSAIIGNVMRNAVNQGTGPSLDSEKVSATRDWAKQHHPEAIGQLTGEMLASALWPGCDNIGEVADVMLRYNQEAGNDRTLVSFLQNIPPDQIGKQQARMIELAEKVRDSSLRDQIITQLKQERTSSK